MRIYALKMRKGSIFGVYENLSSHWNSRYIRWGNIKYAWNQQGSLTPLWYAEAFNSQNLLTDENECEKE